VNKVSGAWVIMLTRRVSGPRGEFLGIVAGVIEARYFEDFYRAISTDEGEAVSLFRRDGTLLARQPHVEGMIGTKVAVQSPWYASVADDGGTYRTPGYIGGVPRIVSVQPLREYPIAVTVGISEDVALAPWRRQSIMIAVSALGAVVGFAILFRALYSLIATAKLNGVDPQAWLTDVLRRIADHPASRLDELLPWHWKQPKSPPLPPDNPPSRPWPDGYVTKPLAE
jgi:hypothetical protein